MPLYNPVNVQVTGPQGLNNFGVGIPDLGGSAYAAMASQIMKSMDKESETVGSIIQQRRGSNYLLTQMANAKIPGTNQQMFDPELMNKIAKGPLAAQQQFLGTAMSTYANAQNEYAQQSGQMRMLGQYMNNPNLLRTHAMISSNGNYPAGGAVMQPTAAPQQSPAQAEPPKEQTKNEPHFTAPKGFSWSQEKFPGTDHDVHALRDNNGSIVGLYNPDGSLYGM